MATRLQKILSSAGVASRRTAETLIAQGRVTLNGQVVREPGTKADPAADDIRVDGRRIRVQRHRYILLYKPRNYVTTRHDPQNRPTVMDLLTGVREAVYPVGRLDFDSEGLLLLTNDGDFADRLMHPRHDVDRTYEVRVKGVPDDKDTARLEAGVVIDGRRTRPARVARVRTFTRAGRTEALLTLTIREGRNRQVRKMLEAVGHPVMTLKRTRVGALSLGAMRPGEWRELSAREVRSLARE